MTKIKLTDLAQMLNGLEVEAFEGISIEGDIELNSDSGGIDPRLAALLGQESSQIAIHLANVASFFGSR